MKPRVIIDVNEAAAAGVVALIVAVWVFALLMVIAKPKAVSQGLAQATRDLDRIENTLRAPGDAYAYAPDALCRLWPATAAAAVRDKIAALASANGVALSGLVIEPGDSSNRLGGLTPVSLRFQADGAYEAVLRLVGALAKSSPEVFLDTADLKSNVTSVTLQMNGRFYCSAYARP